MRTVELNCRDLKAQVAGCLIQDVADVLKLFKEWERFFKGASCSLLKVPWLSTINISLPKGMVEKIDRIVKEQRYASRSELVRDAVRSFSARLIGRRG